MIEDRASRIFVMGDAIFDWTVAASPNGRGVQTAVQYRGAPLLRKILESSARKAVEFPNLPSWDVDSPRFFSEERGLSNFECCPRELIIGGIAQSGGPTRVWRRVQVPSKSATTLEGAGSVGTSLAPPLSHDVLVIDDAHLGFRDDASLWIPSLEAAERIPAHILLKTTFPLTDSLLLDHLAQKYSDRLTICCSVGDLREEYSFIGQPLSWERTGSEILTAISKYREFQHASRIVVLIGMSGAVIFERSRKPVLIFDPKHQEGEWDRTLEGGIDRDSGTCVVSSLAIASASDATDGCRAVEVGLMAAREAFTHWASANPHTADSLKFPVDKISQTLVTYDSKSPFKRVTIPEAEPWQLLPLVLLNGPERRGREKDIVKQYQVVAADIVHKGRDVACADLPVEQMGKWVSLDRNEIESIRSVRNIIGEHLADGGRTKPISIAVFGPPGAGKSFAVEEMAHHLATNGKGFEILRFNLSQLESTDDLAACFQKVRDLTITSGTSLVFWDEFDTSIGERKLAWLAHFLAPMQDGEFSEDGVGRPIGPAIFVFAGGTYSNFRRFRQASERHKGAKAPDFLSRLRGFVDILGPNPVNRHDKAFVLRRALLLRSLLEKKAADQLIEADDTLNIDAKVLEAFLTIKSYVHGARSMEAVIDMSSLSNTGIYDRSSLPAKHQLDIHVDASEFLSLSGRSVARPQFVRRISSKLDRVRSKGDHFGR